MKFFLISLSKLRKKIEELDYQFLNQTVKLTVSVGISTVIPKKSMQSELFFNQADKALYDAAGKRCFFI